MEVAEGIDREHIDEHGNEEYVREEANYVAGHVLQKVNGTHDYGNCIDAEHYHSSEHEPRKVIISSLRPLLSICMVLFLGRVKCLLNQEEYDSSDADQRDDAKEKDKQAEPDLDALRRHR